MLFQPSDMFPSPSGQFGSDVIDATVANVFSLTVNGSSLVGAYQLKIYTNTTESTTVYDSGIVVLETPFVSTSSSGVRQSFDVTVPSNNVSLTPHTAMINEYLYGYKWSITLWETYDSEDPASTRIVSFENYIKTKTPSILVIDSSTVPDTITTRAHLWKAYFNSSSSVMQFKWNLYEVVSGVNTLIYTTDWIYQAPQVWFEYDGLISGKTYAVEAYVVTQDGVSCKSEVATSNVLYTTLEANGATSVLQADGGLQVKISSIQYIEGEPLLISDGSASTDYAVTEDYAGTGLLALDIGSGTYVEFTSSELFSLDTDDSGALVYAFRPFSYTGDEVSLIQAESEDATQSRLSKHIDFEAGLIPNVDSLTPNADALSPSFGIYGQFEYTVNGTTYTAENTEIPIHNYIAVMGPDSLLITEY